MRLPVRGGGETVNVGSRLQELTRNHETDILVSEPVVRQVGDDAAIGFERVGGVAVRARKQEIEVFVPVRVETNADPGEKKRGLNGF